VQGLSRRGFLILGGAAGVTGAAAAVRYLSQSGADGHPVGPAATPASTTVFSPPTARAGAGSGARPPYRWSDPSSWSSGVPGPDQVAVITKPVTLDVDARVAGVVVQPRGQLVFDPGASRRLESSGNVVVLGRLVMRPATPAVGHRLVFTAVLEAAFAGGGMDPIPSDVGLWVMDRGTLDLAGTPRLAWTRVTGSVDEGATTIELQADPEGWRPDDELVLTPTLRPHAPDTTPRSTRSPSGPSRAAGSP
jgi:hypothetical protein